MCNGSLYIPVISKLKNLLKSNACLRLQIKAHGLVKYSTRIKISLKGYFFEKGSNLSLGTRLTRVNRLSRKRCCDTRPDRCQEGSRYLVSHIIKCFAFFSNRRLVGSQSLKRTIYNVDACAEIHFQMKISDLNASTNPKKARFSSNSIFKRTLQILSSNCTI